MIACKFLFFWPITTFHELFLTKDVITLNQNQITQHLLLLNSMFSIFNFIQSFLHLQKELLFKYVILTFTQGSSYAVELLKDVNFRDKYEKSPYMSSSTSLLQTPESMTAWIFSLGPSDRQERAQQESAKTSASGWNKSLASTGRAGET